MALTDYSITVIEKLMSSADHALNCPRHRMASCFAALKNEEMLNMYIWPMKTRCTRENIPINTNATILLKLVMWCSFCADAGIDEKFYIFAVENYVR